MGTAEVAGGQGAFMDEVRAVRNRLMHFSPDLPSEAEVSQMRNMLAFLKAVTPQK